MPICELRLPNNYPKENGKDICDVALKATLKGLEIPDPKDREFRIKAVPSLIDPELQVSFGYGTDEYCQGKEFMPTSEQVRNTCEEISDEVERFGIKKVILDGWKGAAFMIRSLEKRNGELVTPERFKNGIEVKGNIAIRMVFSPSVLESLRLDLKNHEEIFKNILEIFEGEGSVELQFPLEAETEIGVEVDFCDVGDENNFSDEEMNYIMHQIENCLDSGVVSDRNKNTTIWVRQGSPGYMMEHFNVSSEREFVDKTVARTGVKNWEEFNVSCKYELHALPEYMDNGDLELSLGVMEKLVQFLKEKDLIDITVKITEGYSDEEAGKEHYRLTMVFGNGSDNEEINFSKQYSADTDHGKVNGTVRSTVGLSSCKIDEHREVEEKSTGIYIEEVEAVYTDWENQWEEGKFTECTN